MKDHIVRELVNELRDIAIEFHATGQLRARIADTVHRFLQGQQPIGYLNVAHSTYFRAADFVLNDGTRALLASGEILAVYTGAVPDLEARRAVAKALGLGAHMKFSFAWSYLLGVIEDCAAFAEEKDAYTAPEELDADQILFPFEVAKKLRCSRRTLYRWIEAGIFEKPILIGLGRTGWRESYLTKFIAEREALSVAASRRLREGA